MTSGVLLVLAHYSPLFVPNFIAFLPMLAWLDLHRERSVAELLRGGVLFSLAAYGLGLHWIYAMLAISWLAIFMYLGLLILFGAGAALALTLAGRLRSRTGWTYGLLLPMCWIPFEWSRTWGDLRMTADHVGQSLARFPFVIQFDDLLGPYGVGIALLAVQGLAYDCFVTRGSSRGRRLALVLGLLCAGVLGYDAWAWGREYEDRGMLRVALVQPNISLDVKHDRAEEARQDEILARASREAGRQGPELIVWPESARPKLVEHWLDDPASFTMAEVQKLAIETKATILTGVEYARIRSSDAYEIYNAALLVHPDGRLDPAWTAKVYLVPFTEGIPFKRILGPLLEGLGGPLHWLSGGFTPGPASVVLPAGRAHVGVLVCYEELYFDLARALRNAGADLQVVITNDAWFGRTVFQDFVADVVRMRAIETRSSFVRVANTGISGFVDPRGRYHGRTALYESAVEVEDVPLAHGHTLYARVGDVAAWIAIGSLAATLWLARNKKGGVPQERPLSGFPLEKV